jgi:uncharacterized OsmC-like protein
MSMQDVAAAVRRAEAVLQRRPAAGLGNDVPATACWSGNTRVITSDGNGTEVATDMPGELGGSGGHASPGWLLRAGLASCAATRIAMAAALEGIELTTLEVLASSRSDARGLLGLADGDGQPVPPGPLDVQLRVRIAGRGASSERLQALVKQSHACSPVSDALIRGVPVALQIDVEGP